MILWYHLGVKDIDQLQFIEGLLTEEYRLGNTKTERPFLGADDFVELIQYRWVADINIFPSER
jgi:hypothetical protein